MLFDVYLLEFIESVDLYGEKVLLVGNFMVVYGMWLV